ncbi:hypothetical protein AGMMS49941_13300 [Deferribacterales bacterium]|nr:hypothetical protein AGMMS49941_13300 [Deferribacterales bacterium]
MLCRFAQYWIGESYYALKEYDKARDAFETVIAKYPDKPKVPDAMLKLGYTYRSLGQNDKAKATLNSVIKKFPKSEAAKVAKKTLGTWK